MTSNLDWKNQPRHASQLSAMSAVDSVFGTFSVGLEDPDMKQDDVADSFRQQLQKYASELEQPVSEQDKKDGKQPKLVPSGSELERVLLQVPALRKSRSEHDQPEHVVRFVRHSQSGETAFTKTYNLAESVDLISLHERLQKRLSEEAVRGTEAAVPTGMPRANQTLFAPSSGVPSPLNVPDGSAGSSTPVAENQRANAENPGSKPLDPGAHPSPKEQPLTVVDPGGVRGPATPIAPEYHPGEPAAPTPTPVPTKITP